MLNGFSLHVFRWLSSTDLSTDVTGGAKSVLADMLVLHGQENAVEEETPYKCQHFFLIAVCYDVK